MNLSSNNCPLFHKCVLSFCGQHHDSAKLFDFPSLGMITECIHMEHWCRGMDTLPGKSHTSCYLHTNPRQHALQATSFGGSRLSFVDLHMMSFHLAARLNRSDDDSALCNSNRTPLYVLFCLFRNSNKLDSTNRCVLILKHHIAHNLL